MADSWSDTDLDPAEPVTDPVIGQTTDESTASLIEDGSIGDATSDQSSGASSAVETARREAGKVTETAKEQVGQVAGEVGRQAQSLLDETRAQLRSQAQEQSTRIASTLSDLASELRGMADNAPDPSSSVANLVGDGARRLDEFASHLQTGGLEGVMDDLKAMARRRPGAFLAGAAAAGIVVGRLFRNVDLSQQSAGGDVGEGLTSSTPLTSSSVPATDPIGLEPTYAGNGPQNLYGTSREPEAGSGR